MSHFLVVIAQFHLVQYIVILLPFLLFRVYSVVALVKCIGINDQRVLKDHLLFSSSLWNCEKLRYLNRSLSNTDYFNLMYVAVV